MKRDISEKAGQQGRFTTTAAHLDALVQKYPEYATSGKDRTGALRNRIFSGGKTALKDKFAEEHKLRNDPHDGLGSYAAEFQQSDALYQAGFDIWGRDRTITFNSDELLSLGGGGVKPKSTPKKLKSPKAGGSKEAKSNSLLKLSDKKSDGKKPESKKPKAQETLNLEFEVCI